MSFEALSWASAQECGTPAAKLVLMALAHRASKGDALAWPSNAALRQFGLLSRATVTRGLAQLQGRKLIEDSGQRRGKTGQIKVWRLRLDQAELPGLDKPQRGSQRTALKRPKGAQDETLGKGSKGLTVIQAHSDTGSNVAKKGAHSEPRNKSGNKSSKCDKSEKANSIANVRAVIAAWNEMAGANHLPTASALTPDRRTKLGARLDEHGLEPILAAIATVPQSPFLLGHNDQGWKANIDWLARPARCNALIEGTYSGMNGPGNGPGSGGQPMSMTAIITQELKAKGTSHGQ